jgi:hypothetical protein
LIGDDRGGDVSEGVKNRPVFGQPERRELLDMADDGLGDVASVQKSFVEERNRPRFHVSANAGHEDKTAAQQVVRQFSA